MPLTATGVELSVVVPLPSSPGPLDPQQRTELSVRRAQVWRKPAEIVVAVVMPLTATGVELFVVVPSPSWPQLLSPQQRTEPPVRRAQVLLPPAEIAGSEEHTSELQSR